MGSGPVSRARERVLETWPIRREKDGCERMRVLNAVVTGAVLLVVVAAGAFAIVPRVLGWQGAVVLSGSMEPALMTGGLAYIDPVGPGNEVEEIRVGEIITFSTISDSSNRVSHRVVEVIEDERGLRFVTKGDANESVDTDEVTADRVVGTVPFHMPYVGYLTQKLRQREILYVAIGLPAALIIVREAGVVWHELRRRRPGQAELHASLQRLREGTDERG
jgi:signal peptidase I